LRVWITDIDGKLINGGASAPPAQQDDGADGQHVMITREDGVVLMGMRYTRRQESVLPGAKILIGVDTRERETLMRTYDRATLLLCALGVAATVLLSMWVARHGLRPLRQLSRDAASIEPDRLSRRLTAQHDSLELVPLVQGFNRALDRVEDAYQQVQGFSADVAHELRTPLATLISGTEVALSRERSVEELQDLLVSNLEELHGLASMINDMLFLALADRGELAGQLQSVSLRNEALAVADYLEASLEDARHSIQVKGDQQVKANSSLLRRALVNLVANANRYASVDEAIVIRFELADGKSRVSVSNTGPPVSVEVRTRMFDRFWRGDAARTASTQNHGLGLAIVRAVARMHGGDAFAHSNDGITTIGFTLEAVPEADAPGAPSRSHSTRRA
jgi:two-component system heavy metal sensor histidine kinase CusS